MLYITNPASTAALPLGLLMVAANQHIAQNTAAAADTEGF